MTIHKFVLTTGTDVHTDREHINWWLWFHTGFPSWHNEKFPLHAHFEMFCVFTLRTFCQLWGLRTMQQDPYGPPVFVCTSSKILCQDTGYIRGSQSVPGGMLNMGTDGLQLLQDICLLWVTPSVPDAKQNGWWMAHHIHICPCWRAGTAQLASQRCLILFINEMCYICCNIIENL